MYFPLRVYVEIPTKGKGGVQEMSLSDVNTPPAVSPYRSDKPHIFCLHPHGILGMSWLASLALDGMLMRERMGLDMRVLTFAFLSIAI